MTNPDEPLEVLVLRCQIGDSGAFEELFERFQPRLRYFVRRIDRAGPDTDDLLQDIWLMVFRKIDRLRNPGLFAVWLYKIARNRVYRHSQQRRRGMPAPEEALATLAGHEEPDFDASAADRIHQALAGIQPHHREVLMLHFLERMRYEDIAEVVGCTPGTVKSRMHYAKQSLRRELERDHG